MSDQWYYDLGGLELGPVSFDELLELARTEQLAADDLLKAGTDGKWRRAGSIGRLAAVLPFQVVESKPRGVAATLEPSRRNVERVVQAPTETSVAAQEPADYQQVYSQAKQSIAAMMMSQAQSAYQVAEAQARAEIAWAFAPNIDRHWWGWMGNVEFGPVEFEQVFALMRNGQLKPTDFVRNGQFGQFVPASSLPGVVNAVRSLAKAVETLTIAKAQANSALQLSVPVQPRAVDSTPPKSSDSRSLDVKVPQDTGGATPQPVTPLPATPVSENVMAPRSSRVEASPKNAPLEQRRTPATAFAVQGGSTVAQGSPQAARPVVGRSAPVIATRTNRGPGLLSQITEGIRAQNPIHALSALLVTGVLGFGYWTFASGPSRPVSVHPVTGRVVIDGEPLANASIVLHRIGNSKVPANLHPRARAKDDGTFALETFDPADGAPNGEFIATVFLNPAIEVNGETQAGPNVLPAVYSRPDTSPLKLTISASTNELQPLELTRK